MKAGFTLVELLIVISILGVLAAVLLPQVFGVNHQANENATQANMLLLDNGIKTFAREYGVVPPDDFRVPDKRIDGKWGPENGRNTGIESLVCFLSLAQRTGVDLSEQASQLTNTDGDQHGAELVLLRRKERLELADHWNTPLVYFARPHLEGVQQVVIDADGDAVQVKARRRADGVVFGKDFQLLSAGRDRTFGTEDDVHHPAN